MSLSVQAKTELKEILRKDIGPEVENFSEAELEEFGLFLLTIGVNSLKVRARLQQ
jgi:hypothetical protein